jgi:hypothetical protein
MALPENLRLAPELLEVIDSYRVCEFATLSRSGTPIAWPTAMLRRPDGALDHHVDRVPAEGVQHSPRRAGRVAVLRPNRQRPEPGPTGAGARHRDLHR